MSLSSGNAKEVGGLYFGLSDCIDTILSNRSKNSEDNYIVLAQAGEGKILDCRLSSKKGGNE